MDNDAKNSNLTWTSQKRWGSVGNTHYAETNGWRYTADQPRKGAWVLRGWGPDNRFLYRGDFRTLKEAKTEAENHADGVLSAKLAEAKDATPTADELPELPELPERSELPELPELPELDVYTGSTRQGARTTMTDVLTGLVDVADRARASIATHVVPVLQNLARGFQTVSWLRYYRPTDCTCPTPTHRMSCGHGARPVVCHGPAPETAREGTRDEPI